MCSHCHRSIIHIVVAFTVRRHTYFDVKLLYALEQIREHLHEDASIAPTATLPETNLDDVAEVEMTTTNRTLFQD